MGRTTETDDPDTVKPMAHAVSSEKLKAIMHRLNQLTFEKELAPMKLKEVRERHIQELMATVDELLTAAEELTDALPGFSMAPEERDTFIDMAKRLKSEAYRIRYTAEVGSDTELDLAYQRLNHTCAACHQLFRF
jgi:cytochrome c556